MVDLPNSRVRRGGETAKYWYQTNLTVDLSTAAGEVRINFTMSSKGIGNTKVQVGINPKDFPELIKAMCIVNKQMALEAMSIELTRQLASPPVLYEAFERKGELRIYDKAFKRYRSKRRGGSDEDEMIRNAISDLVYPISNID